MVKHGAVLKMHLLVVAKYMRQNNHHREHEMVIKKSNQNHTFWVINSFKGCTGDNACKITETKNSTAHSLVQVYTGSTGALIFGVGNHTHSKADRLPTACNNKTNNCSIKCLKCLDVVSYEQQFFFSASMSMVGGGVIETQQTLLICT